MKVKIEVELEPFRVPNYVLVKQPPKLRQDGFGCEAKYALSDLDKETLTAMCEEFTHTVFEKAGCAIPDMEETI